MPRLSVLAILLASCVLVLSTSAQSDTCRETTVTLSNGVEMPRVGFGLAGMKGKETRESVRLHFKAGFRMLDGAEAKEWYDDEAAAKELANTKDLKREDVFIGTFF